MKLVLCDTNIFISLFKDIPGTKEQLLSIGSENVLISSVTIMELFRGMESKKEMKAMEQKIKKYNVLHFNDKVSLKSVELINTFKLSHNLEIPDAIIGAMSIVYKIPLFTYNTKDFKFMPGIDLY